MTQTFRYLINSKSKQKTSKTKYTQLKIKVKSLIFVLILLFVSMFSFLLISESVKASGNIPNISNPYPSNESTNQIINTNLSITINDPEGDNMDIIWSNNASTASADWIGVNSSNINSFCGQYDSETYSLAYGLNGNGRWVHDDNHVHWFILDFGDSYFIEKVRGRSNYNMDPIDVNIYVSEINGSWGSPVASNISTWQDTDVWQEVDITDKNGRYIKVEIIETEYSNHILHWGKLSPYLTIFDVYGAANWTTFGSNSSITNGTYTQTCSDFSEYNTTYWWRVIVSDGSSYNESIYHFTTENYQVPIVYTNTSSGVEETNATINGYLEEDGVGNCLVWFEHGQTEDYGNTTSNETKENGQSFSYNLGGTPTLYEYYEGGFIDGISIYGAISSGQTFTVGATGTNQNHYFGRIGLRLRRIGNPGNILVGIKATNAGSLPTGDFLTYTYYDSSQIGSMNWYYIDFSDIYQLTAGTKYALILKCPNGDGGNYINWEYNSISASYPGGNRIWTITNGSSWSHDSTVDLSFREYELIPLSPGTLYHYRAVANSNISTINGSDFTLLTKPYEPNTFSSSSGRARQINLTWTKGNGANTTYIIRKNGSFPNNRSDGTLIYNNTGNSYYDIGLTPETEYYYRAWSYTTWTHNTTTTNQWSDAYDETNTTTSTITTPTIQTNTTTNTEENATTLNAYLNNDGGENCTIRFQYGTTTNYGTNTTNQTKNTGQEISANIIDLTPGQLYHYRAYANNTQYNTTGTNQQFLTKPNELSNLTGTTISTTRIDLTWTKGTGTNNTMIRRKTGSYPTDKTDGTQIYNETGTSYSDTGLTPSTTYYYKAWSYTTWTHNTTTTNKWSDLRNIITCVTAASGGGGTNPPSSPPPQPTGETDNNEVDEEDDEDNNQPQKIYVSQQNKEDVEDLFNIDLNKKFYATDTNRDGIYDTFTDPNNILDSLNYVNINNNDSFLISINEDIDKLIIWDVEADLINQVIHLIGEITDKVVDTINSTATFTVEINKSGWVYFEIPDEYQDYANFNIITSDKRLISKNLIWRNDDKIFVLDDPSIKYYFIFSAGAITPNFLFDVILELTPYSVNVGDSVNAVITLINVGESGLVNARINYTLFLGNNIIWSEEEDLSVQGQLAFVKKISTDTLNPGEYTFKVVHYYGDNQNATAEGIFIVEALSEGFPVWIIILIISIVGGSIYSFIWYRKHYFIKIKDYYFEETEDDDDENNDADDYDDVKYEDDDMHDKIDELIQEKENNSI